MTVGPLLREASRLDRSRLAVGVGFSGALGFAAPLAIGLATGHASEGVVAAGGALIVGFANLGDGYPVRAATLLATTTAATFAALLGGLLADSVAASAVLIGAWGFVGALLVALGTRLAFVGMLSTWALLLGADLGLHGGAAPHEALLILGGGLLQTGIALLAWPLRPDAAERRAVAAAYLALAAYARDPTPAPLKGAADTLAAAAEAVGSGPGSTTGRGSARALAEQGEWIRLEIAALAGGDGPGGEEDSTQVTALLTLAAIALEEIGASLRRPGGGGREAAVATASRLRTEAAAIGPAKSAAATALATWIGAAAERHRDGLVLDPWRPRTAVADALHLLRAQLTTASPAFRHATRLALALMVAVIVYRSLGLGFGYWVPLTVLFVLKPDYVTTYSRGIGRIAGTMAGIAVAWAVVSAFTPSDGAIVALLGLLAFAAYALYPANYALFSVVLTILVALIAQFGGGSAIGALESRLLDTAIGGAIALGAFAIWPTREAPRLKESLATLVDTHHRWLDAILGALGRADPYEPRRLRSLRLQARGARREAEAALARALAEPVRRRPDPSLPRAVLAAFDRICESTLVMTAALHGGARLDGAARPGPYARELDDCLSALAAALRSGTWKPLHPPRVATPELPPASDDGAGDQPPSALLVTEAKLRASAIECLDEVAGGRVARRPRTVGGGEIPA
jgi:hypothetical protein